MRRFMMMVVCGSLVLGSALTAAADPSPDSEAHSGRAEGFAHAEPT
jgi:hypothetical protein